MELLPYVVYDTEEGCCFDNFKFIGCVHVRVASYTVCSLVGTSSVSRDYVDESSVFLPFSANIFFRITECNDWKVKYYKQSLACYCASSRCP